MPGPSCTASLAYLVKCAAADSPYTVFGYQGKQVRDNIHAVDFVNALWHFFENAAFGRGLQHGRRPPFQLFHDRGHRCVRNPDRTPHGMVL